MNATTLGDAALETDVRQFCGGCHVFPQPDSVPKAHWYDEVKRGFDFYYKSKRTDLKPPPQARVVSFFRDRALDKLAPLKEPCPVTESPLRFEQQPITGLIFPSAEAQAVSFVDWKAVPDGKPVVRISDMRLGTIHFVPMGATSVSPREQPCRHPAAIRDADLDGNGRTDLLISDLGSFLPEDHDKGQLVWLPDGVGNPQAAPQVLLRDVGRIADARPGDFDGDGDEDVVVAEFGWHTTGGIHVIWNEGTEGADNKRLFRPERLDVRPGTIQVPTVDLDGDGRLDFVAVISQEHETVLAFLNRPGGFVEQPLFVAPDPGYGSSGIELADLDQDGDLDVLYTNGDTFDSFIVKPYHGLIWLENTGKFPFVARTLTYLPGIHRALAGDLDGDGDLDIVASALVPKKLMKPEDRGSFDALIWLEQTQRGEFHRHSIWKGLPVHASIALGDIDQDNDLDVIAGAFYEEIIPDQPSALIFINQGKARSGK